MAVTDRKAFLLECAALAGLDADDEAALPRTSRVVRISPLTGTAVVFAAGEAWPLSDGMTIAAVFHDADEIRVYTLPGREPKPGERLMATKYTLPKGSLDVIMDVMPMDTFKASVATEYSDLDEATASVDDFTEEDTPPNGAVEAPGAGGVSGTVTATPSPEP